MIKLVPEWAYEYEAYWKTMRSRNIWFIHTRYGAVLMLATIFLLANYIFDFQFSELQKYVLISVTIAIFAYNLILHWFRKYLSCTPGKFNPLHLSLIQIILDLMMLMLLVYYTGSIETPLYFLFIFHMIIGSLILPEYVILIIALMVTSVFSSIVALEYLDIIPHHHLYGIHEFELKNNFNFIFSTLGLFNFTIFTAVLMTSRIAKRLYKREEELIQTLRKLDEAEKTKQKYTMAVVHEIKSPIVAAQSIVEIVKNGYLGEINDKVKEKLERTIIRTQEALQLINNILRISKLKLLGEVSYERINLVDLINNIITQKSDTITNKLLKIEFDGSKETFIDGDQVLLELIISNLLGNAIKYTPETGKIKVNIEQKEDIILLDISDTGIGIPEDEIKLIYKQFFRASNISNYSTEGSGLGLSLVKEIVERFNGSINIVSPSSIGDESNPGTSVRIILPIKRTN